MSNESRSHFFSIFVILGLAVGPLARAQSEVFVMGALGDSVSTGFNSKNWGNNLDLSWATGGRESNSVNSHYRRLARVLEEPVAGINVAKAGSIAKDLQEQIDKLLEETQILSYVTVQIGANDVCHWNEDYQTNLDKFENHMNDAMDRLITTNPDLKVLMVAIPNMYHLHKIGSENQCQWKWDLFGMCSNLLSSDRSNEERQAFQIRVDLANRTLKDIANRYENIKFDPSLGNYKFSQDEISRKDCFHPSASGQELIAKMTWNSGWFSGR